MKAKSQQQQGGVSETPAGASAQPQQQQAQTQRRLTPQVSPGIVDLAPPVYKNFVDMPPRPYAPIGNDGQYHDYYKQYQDLYATYYSLASLLKSSIASVQRAYEELAVLPQDSPLKPQKEEELRQLLETRACLTEPWNSAFNTLHAELQCLRQQMRVWVQRTVGGGAAAAGSDGSHSAGQQAPVGHGGKGMMVAAAAARLAPVGA
jgi:hypothetical protein